MELIKGTTQLFSNFNNQVVLWSEPDVAGWLDKRGGNFISWKTRFFILQGSSLFYFLSNNNIENVNPIGFLPMEGCILEVASCEEGGIQRKWCFKLKLGPGFERAKRSTYVFSAPSKQAMEEWFESIQFASNTQDHLKAQLHKARRQAVELRLKLLKSPSNFKMITDAQGVEGQALQKELNNLKLQLSTLHNKALEAMIQADKFEGAAMEALAKWDVFYKHLHGSIKKSVVDFRKKLNIELEMTKELCQLIQTKTSLLEGHMLEDLDKDFRRKLTMVCEKAFNNVERQQTKVRVKAPRYTTEVNPYIFPEHDTQFKHTSHIFESCSKISRQKKVFLQKIAQKIENKETTTNIIQLSSKIGNSTEFPIKSYIVNSTEGSHLSSYERPYNLSSNTWKGKEIQSKIRRSGESSYARASRAESNASIDYRERLVEKALDELLPRFSRELSTIIARHSHLFSMNTAPNNQEDDLTQSNIK